MGIFKSKEAAKDAVDQAKQAIDAGMQELDDAAFNDVAGGGAFDRVPRVVEHSYNDEDKGRY